MAAPPRLKAIVLEEGEDIPDWARKIKAQIDTFMTSVTDGLTKKLTREENILSQKRVLDFTTDADVAASFPMKFTVTLPTRPERIDCGQAVAPDGGSFSGAVTVNQWQMSDGTTVQLNNITGLSPGTHYKLTLFVY